MRKLLSLVALVFAARAVATVPSTASSAGPYTCNGTTTVFSVPWKFLASTDLVVTKTLTATGAVSTLTLTTDYTVQNTGTTSGGTVTLTSGSKCASGYTLLVERTLLVIQPTSLRAQTSASAQENAVDRLTMIAQQTIREQDERDDEQDLALAQGAVGGNDTYITATGTATARKLKDRFADTPTILNFGVDPTGVTDSTVGLDAAGATGKAVRFVSGTYKATDTVNLVAGTVFYCAEPGTCVLEFSGTTGTLRRALSLEGAGAGLDGLKINVVSGPFSTSAKLAASDTFVRRCKITHASADIPTNATASVYVLWASSSGAGDITGVVIEDNDVTFTGPCGDGIHADAAPGIQVLRNTVHDFTFTEPEPHVGGFFDLHYWGIYLTPGSGRGAVIGYNTVRDMPGSGIAHREEAASEPTNNAVRVIGNRIDTVDHFALSVEYAHGPVIEGNWVARANYLLYLYGGLGATISGNHFEQLATIAEADANYVMLDIQSPTASITGNTIGKRGTATTAIRLYRESATVAGNQFNDDPPRTAVHITGAADRSSVVGNIVAATTGATSGYYPILSDAENSSVVANTIDGSATGICLASAASASVVVGNTLTNQTSSAILDTGTGNVVASNTTDGGDSGSVRATYFVHGAAPSASGVLRLSYTDAIASRNEAASADLTLVRTATSGGANRIYVGDPSVSLVFDSNLAARTTGYFEGQFWVECSGTTPARVCATKVYDGGAVRIIASVTY